MRRPAHLFLPIAALLLCGSMAHAQRSGITIAPPELYPGVNEITVTAAKGISGIEAIGSDNLTFEQVGSSSDGTTRTFRVVVYSGSDPVSLKLSVTDADGRKGTRRLGLGVHWTLDRINLGRIRQGEQSCAEFSIRAVNNNVVERVTIDNPRLQITMQESLPYTLDGEYLRYAVCFKGDVEPGIYKFPVTAWIQREYPTAGEATYPISDTGYVIVLARDTEGKGGALDIRTKRDLIRAAVPLPDALTPALPTPPLRRQDGSTVEGEGPTIGQSIIGPTIPRHRSVTATKAIE